MSPSFFYSKHGEVLATGSTNPTSPPDTDPSFDLERGRSTTAGIVNARIAIAAAQSTPLKHARSASLDMPAGRSGQEGHHAFSSVDENPVKKIKFEPEEEASIFPTLQSNIQDEEVSISEGDVSGNVDIRSDEIVRVPKELDLGRDSSSSGEDAGGVDSIHDSPSPYSPPEGSEDMNNRSELIAVPQDWLLHAAIASKSGMLVTVRNTLRSQASSGWHEGAYEGARGVVLSVFNTGANNCAFPSTARVKFHQPMDPSNDTYSVPVSFLWPVEPDKVDQEALIIQGERKGDVVRLREEVSGGWFVSAAYDHYEVERGELVRLSADKE